MNRTMLAFTVLVITSLAAVGEPLTVTAAATDKDSSIHIPYDAKKLTAELAFYPEVQKPAFYYLSLFPRAHVQGTATLSTGQAVGWFHYECGGLYLRFTDGSERYFLHPDSIIETSAPKTKEPNSTVPK